MRLMSGLLAGQAFDSVLTGDASLSGRPMRRVVDPLTRWVPASTPRSGGTAPLAHPAADAPCRASTTPCRSPAHRSNPASCWPGLYASGRTCITEPAPTRDHTERMLAGMGYPAATRRSRASAWRADMPLHGHQHRYPCGYLLGRVFPGGSEHRARLRPAAASMSA